MAARRSTRWLIDIAALLTLAMLAFGTLHVLRDRREENAAVERTATSVRRMELEVKYRGATGAVTVTGRGFPATVDPTWFKDDPPLNELVSRNRPWVEVATPDQADMLHPAIRMTLDDRLAAFWYNPYQGVVRARVPVMVNDDAALELYNQINGCSLLSIFDRGEDRVSLGGIAATTGTGESKPPETAFVEPDAPMMPEAGRD